ncbi:MAG: fumarate hydratase, partial [Oscillospiraceae bacterium]|nr:fumarate hydratase [Oscillospiraceae bacterium]
MRIIECESVTEAVAGLCKESNLCIGGDIRGALVKARRVETSAAAKSALETLIENAEVAERESLPACQ